MALKPSLKRALPSSVVVRRRRDFIWKTDGSLKGQVFLRQGAYYMLSYTDGKQICFT